VALQTFYKHFEGKDQVLLAVIEDLILESCVDLRERGKLIDDPIDRLRLYVHRHRCKQLVAGGPTPPEPNSSLQSTGGSSSSTRSSWRWLRDHLLILLLERSSPRRMLDRCTRRIRNTTPG